MAAADRVRRELEALEAELELVGELRALAKTEGGRMTEFGRAVIAAGRDNEVRQSFMARLLDVSAGAISQHYKRL